jgi:osmotically-inducible protein OsmY
MLRSDQEIMHDVREELNWDPQIGARRIVISVCSSVVTLAGFVRSFGEKVRAAAAAKRVAGVVGVVNDVEVRLSLLARKSDPQIAREVLGGIQAELPTLQQRIRVGVVDGRVTLQGYVEWRYQRARAEEVAQRAKGVRSISNDILVKRQILSVGVSSAASGLRLSHRPFSLAGSGRGS